MSKLWERLKKNPVLMFLAIALLAVVAYIIVKSSQKQTGNPGGQGTQGAGIDPQSGLPYGQTSSQGGYYLLSEEDVPGPINVTIGSTVHPTAKAGPPGPRGPRGRPGPRGHDEGVHVGRVGRSHRSLGSNPNVSVPRGELTGGWLRHERHDQWAQRGHVTHIVSPVPLGSHQTPQHHARPIASSGHITTKGNRAGQNPTPFVRPNPHMGIRNG